MCKFSFYEGVIEMNSHEIFSLVIKNLGIVGFIIFLLFLLLIYIKKGSERKIIIYVFSFLVVFIVIFTLYLQVNRSSNEIKKTSNSISKSISNTTKPSYSQKEIKAEKSMNKLPPSLNQNYTRASMTPIIKSYKPNWCDKKLNKPEKIICRYSVLWSLEKENVQLYTQLYGNIRQENKAELDTWLLYRDQNCTSEVACLQLYNDRITVLKERLSINKKETVLAPFYYDSDDSKPGWCKGRHNRDPSEKFICNHDELWFYDNKLNKLYAKALPSDKLALKIVTWRKKIRSVNCKKSLFKCIKSYHEKISQIYYQVSI